MPQSSVARRICQGEVPTTQTSVYTVGDSARVLLSSISFHNSAGVTRRVTMWIVPAGQSPAASNQFVDPDLLNRQPYRENGIGQTLEPGDQIYLDADGASVSYFISGALLTEV